MTDRDTLWAIILADPTDDTARLVLADLLQESDDPNDQAHGRFLWAGVTTARFRDHDLIDDPNYYSAQSEIGAVTATGLPALWLARLNLGPISLTAGDWGWDCAHDRVTVRVGQSRGVFARGMLAELSVTLEEWYTAGSLALERWPLERATMTDVRGLTFAIGPTEQGWKLTARLKVPARRVALGGGVIPAAVAPAAMLAQSAGDWWAEEEFPDRAALVGGLAAASARLVDDLRDAAGDRWPSPSRNRR